MTEQDQSEYTICEAAEILQVSTRTLRHWDEVGLLQ
ncbi:MAG: MerR family DNA-binding transcriptional regulator, partial [Corynebacterium casei]|nr:MerR family DNA-binding transcriptional regulator [Corynebacterium casei]